MQPSRAKVVALSQTLTVSADYLLGLVGEPEQYLIQVEPFDEKATMGSRIREARQAAGLSPEELAQKVHTTAEILRSYEADEKMPSLRHLHGIAWHTDVPMSEFWSYPFPGLQADVQRYFERQRRVDLDATARSTGGRRGTPSPHSTTAEAAQSSRRKREVRGTSAHDSADSQQPPPSKRRDRKAASE